MWGGGVAWGDGVYVGTDALGLDGGGVIHTTAGGGGWTQNDDFSSPGMPGDYWSDWQDDWEYTSGLPVCYGSGRFVAVTSFGWIITSTDGDDWETARAPFAHQRPLRGVAEKGGVFVAVGDAGTILRSTDGSTWRRCEAPSAEDFLAVAGGQHWFVAVGSNETVLISADGQVWQQIAVATLADGTVLVAGEPRATSALRRGSTLP